MEPIESRRERLVASLRLQGIEDPAVLRALKEVPRHRFLPQGLAEFAYQDTPLPIAEGQTISQPYVVAWMTQAAQLKPGQRVLEVGTGSGYAAAVASRIATDVYSVERHGALAQSAGTLLGELGYHNVHVLHGDGTGGWPEHAPYDVILVTAGGPSVPQALLDQLKPGGTLVMPVGPADAQMLVRVRRGTDGQLEREELGGVRFVPLIGEAGWRPSRKGLSDRGLAGLIRESAEPVGEIESAELGALVERMARARVVLLGEATHGTSEFYRMRARITQELIERHGFTVVAVEADWPDAARVDRFVRHLPPSSTPWKPFARFPTWMWRNEEVRTFSEWLRRRNAEVKDRERRTGFYGLDLYSLFTSADSVVRYLDSVDPAAARVARERYGSLTPWQRDPAAYGRAVVTGRFESCETEVVKVLVDLLVRRLDYAARDGERFLDAVQNARVVADAERYYRIMYRGNVDSWNLRDQHMFDTLSALLAFHGSDSRAVVWAHNSHLGDAAATEMGARGEHNVGQLCRRSFGSEAYLLGFGTDHGTVVAATNWDEAPELKTIRPAHAQSYEALCHQSGVPAFLLPLRQARREEVREELTAPRLERAIGVIYRPETELQSHYFEASLSRQFDEWIWFDRTTALHPLGTGPLEPGLPDTYPFGV
ncbi:MAG: protein-L-isoaspartate(D-aspartate) O-methyltransferase [Myxococcaceae bacterium]|nr:MAG: protein-L-isoaspartate(D-aspartate) O-methyltransferase [Myxococcaceae bacterium]